MKTLSATLLTVALILGGAHLRFTASAGLPEPDNLVYGNIVLDEQFVSASRTDVVIEARRTLGGAAIASYRMGSNPRIGNFYLLKLPLESGPAGTNANISQQGDSVFIVIRDASGDRGQTTFMIPDRGHAERIDFGNPPSDSDQDGLPDAWEIANFGNTGMTPTTINPNGQTTRNNFVSGSNPNDANTLFTLEILFDEVFFNARKAEGPGYTGRTRTYSLEASENPGISPWIGIDGFTNIVGNNQTVIYLAPLTNASTVYRARIALEE